MRYMLFLLIALVANAVSAQSLHVQNGKLYGPTSTELRLRGINRAHWDQNTYGTGSVGANVVRMSIDFSQPVATSWGAVQSQILSYGMTPIVGNWIGTCNSDPNVLSSIVDTWIAQADTWKQLNANGIVNIANEWGPTNSSVWRDSYIAQVKRLRAAGFTGTLMVDSGGCGQDPNDIVQYGAAVLASDPLHNILFDVHVYGNFVLNATVSWETDYATSMAALKATGLPIVLGEFGPGNNVGPSPTTITPQQVISTAESNGWGWLAWAMDDNDQAGCQSDGYGFSMTYTCWGDATHQGDANLTPWGLLIATELRTLNSAPTLTSGLAYHCLPNYACAIQLSASDPAGLTVTYSLSGNPPQVSLSSDGIFGWWTSPIAGVYPMTITLTDSVGHQSTNAVTLTISW